MWLGNSMTMRKYFHLMNICYLRKNKNISASFNVLRKNKKKCLRKFMTQKFAVSSNGSSFYLEEMKNAFENTLNIKMLNKENSG